MTNPSALQAILDIAVEDSYALSEVVSVIRQTQTTISSADAKALARKTVAQMLERGLLAVTRLEVPGGKEVELGRDEAISALADDLAWLELPHWRPHVRILATQQGRAAYYGHGKE